MFAVVQIGSSQYVVQEKDEILVDRLGEKEGKNILLDKVLLYADYKDKVQMGTPYLENVSVEVRVLGEEKGEKIRVFKMKAKKRYQKTRGHRSLYTRLKVLKISALAGKVKTTKAKEKVPAKKKTPSKKATVAKKASSKKRVSSKKDD